MELALTAEHRGRVRSFQDKHHTGVVTLLFTDVVGSTQLKQDLGDLAAVELLAQHHTIVREILGGFDEAEEISTAGDSFFLVFVRPSDAVRFSLCLQARLRAVGKGAGRRVQDRIGIHVGEVLIEEREGAVRDLYGIQVDACARISDLSQPGQILLSRFAFDNARQVLKGQELEGIGSLSWLNHGPYLFKGIDETLEICEVGEVGLAPLSPPADSAKARRWLSAVGEPVLGWRPALGQAVPNTRWTLERKLGEGGFGEVWLGRHDRLKERRVFKFCFQADRVRSLKREVTLFRLLKERVGAHPNIVGVQEVNFDTPPYYIVMEYAEGADLAAWYRDSAQAGPVPLSDRLEIVAQVADALQAAHETGIVHRDVKPSNIVVTGPPPTQSATPLPTPVARLTDFGIGQVVSEEVLGSLTKLGFTQTVGWTESPRSGTYLYMAPELLAGKRASPQSDIYSLGVVLYQLVLGDFGRPVTTDWAAQVTDPFLREDLAKCFAGDPGSRFSSAGNLACSLRTLPQRRLAQERREKEAAEERIGEFRRRARWIALGVALLVCLLRWVEFRPLELLEWGTYDLRVRQALQFHPPVATIFGFVFIDAESVSAVADGSLGYRFGLLWPRQVYGRLIGELAAQGAKAVALDIVFTGSRVDHPPVQMPDGSLMESDEFFAHQMRAAGNVIFGVPGDLVVPALFLSNAVAAGDVSAEEDSDRVLRRARLFRMSTIWHPVFRKVDDIYTLKLREARVEPRQIVVPRAETNQPALVIPLDQDGKFDLADFIGTNIPAGLARRQKPFTQGPIWHMGVVLAAEELGLDLTKAEIDLPHGRIRLRGPGGLERVIPVDASGFAYIDWSVPPDHPRLARAPIRSLLAQARQRDLGQTIGLAKGWSGKLVTVGSSGVDIADRGATPLGRGSLLAGAHWNLANTIITGRFVRRSPLALELGLVILFAAAGTGLTCRTRPWLASLLVVVLTAVYVALGVGLYVHSRYWLPLAAPLLGLVSVSAWLVVWRLRLEKSCECG